MGTAAGSGSAWQVKAQERDPHDHEIIINRYIVRADVDRIDMSHAQKCCQPL